MTHKLETRTLIGGPGCGRSVDYNPEKGQLIAAWEGCWYRYLPGGDGVLIFADEWGLLDTFENEIEEYVKRVLA